VPSITIFWSFLNPRPVKCCCRWLAVGGQCALQGWRRGVEEEAVLVVVAVLAIGGWTDGSG